ncbi:MAG TPA: hypothetical protein VGG45_06125 [Terracidiphilus sp.]|jgi:hypothetical protein
MRSLSGSLLVAFLSAACFFGPQVFCANAQRHAGPSVMVNDEGVPEFLDSIHVPALQNAPFSAIVHSEWIKPLDGGGTYTTVNQRRIARDSLGRIYEERWSLVPKDGTAQSQMNVIQIANPVERTLYNCFLHPLPRQCSLQKYAETPMAAYHPAVGHSGPLPNGKGFRIHEDLGIRSFEGVDALGTRDTTTYNQGVIGNDTRFSVMREFWFAEKLGIDLQVEISNPLFGKEIFTITDLSAAEPDPALFQLPEGFTVVDQRKPATSSPDQ